MGVKKHCAGELRREEPAEGLSVGTKWITPLHRFTDCRGWKRGLGNQLVHILQCVGEGNMTRGVHKLETGFPGFIQPPSFSTAASNPHLYVYMRILKTKCTTLGLPMLVALCDLGPRDSVIIKKTLETDRPGS